MQSVLYSLNFILMIAMPLLLGWWISKRRSVGWRLFAIGCATFIISQIGHIPFNYFALPILNEQISTFSGVARLLITALFLGLSAALFEESLRYIGYRYWAKDARSWGKGMMLGAGHGGAEAIILGILVAINTVFLIAWSNNRFTVLIPSEQEPLISAALDSFFSVPWYAALLGALERFFAIILHLSLSLMVMMAFVKRQPLWLAAAIVWHAIIDALAVISVSAWGVYAAEFLIALMAISSLSLIIRLRKPEPEPAAIEPLPVPELVRPLQLDVTTDKLDESKYST